MNFCGKLLQIVRVSSMYIEFPIIGVFQKQHIYIG